MKDEEFLSTGETARLLGISRSTVSRRYDDGSLCGKTHPITGERLISVESTKHFLEGHVRPSDTNSTITKHLVLRSEAQDLIGLLDGLVVADRRIKVTTKGRGTEALVASARKPTDLLILDDTATDISCPDIIRTLRELEDRHKLAVLCRLRDHSHQEAAGWGADAVLPSGELQSHTLETRIYELLKLTPRARHDYAGAVVHRRQWIRHDLRVPGSIGVYRVQTPEERAWGSVVVENISLGGAGLSKVQVDSNSLPAEPFRMLLRIDTPPLPDWQAHCQVVRLRVNGQVTAGVQFVEMTQDCRNKILAFERAYTPSSSAAASA
jgi:hypothetical protein